MSTSLRLSEKWFRRALWLVAFVFAGFLIGLGSTVEQDLPKIEHRYTMEDFIDKPAATQARNTLKDAELVRQNAQDALDQAELKVRTAQTDSTSARETFNNWLATRHATGQSDQDAELVRRTKALDGLKAAERRAASQAEAQQQIALDARQAEAQAQARLQVLERAANEGLQKAERKQELRVFLYRLALTLPLLVIAGWLFKTKRKGTYWPFVWGFILFALFAFFVELVPYLPSYGGYVRYLVGIVITVLVGRQAIVSLNRYLERQKLAEQLPDAQRRQDLSYDLALARLAKSVCPGCERSVDLKNVANDFCPHCGIGLHNHCVKCNSRKSSFAQFCHACGTAAGAGTGAAA
ncbi:serine endopeptidase [Paraherbaspirillum soli]|uniref:Serine endopeptidase n=1 Tax=Paraherbaspirillum soli TaxID=631222 RepID=A0ABW0M5F9_9BURK